MPFNHNIERSVYIAALETELASATDKARKAAIVAELDEVRGSKAVPAAPVETRATAAPAPVAEPMADFGGK